MAFYPENLKVVGPAAILGPAQAMAGHSQMDAPTDWMARSQDHLTKMKELRQEVRKQFHREAMAERESDKAPNIGGPAVEDRLKRRNRLTQGLAGQVAHKTETVQHLIFQVRQGVSELSRATTSTRGALSVVMMRLEMRAQRPPSELLEDSFDESLHQEHASLSEVIGKIVIKLEAGQDLINPLEDAKADMHHSRLTLHLDRSGYTQQLLDRVSALERAANLFCRDTRQFLDEADKRGKKVAAKTVAAMKHRIAATVELKEQIEKDMKETRRTINDAELHLDRLERQLQVQLAMPERASLQHAEGNKKLAAHTGVLADLRAKIKAAAYTGGHGRDLNVLFGRFDRDGTGALDEDEVRRAFRRACKIKPSAVSDAEIASLCGLLDEDNSGTVSISEIIDFLCADVNVESLEEQCSWSRAALQNLKAAQLQSQGDLRSKVAAWKIDAACSRVNAIKGLKLDGLPSPRQGGNSSQSARGGAPALPATPGRPGTANQPALAGSAGNRPMSSPKGANGIAWSGPKASPRKPQTRAQPLPALASSGQQDLLAQEPADISKGMVKSGQGAALEPLIPGQNGYGGQAGIPDAGAG